jgi:hypothetical protein
MLASSLSMALEPIPAAQEKQQGVEYRRDLDFEEALDELMYESRLRHTYDHYVEQRAAATSNEAGKRAPDIQVLRVAVRGRCIGICKPNAEYFVRRCLFLFQTHEMWEMQVEVYISTAYPGLGFTYRWER